MVRAFTSSVILTKILLYSSLPPFLSLTLLHPPLPSSSPFFWLALCSPFIPLSPSSPTDLSQSSVTAGFSKLGHKSYYLLILENSCLIASHNMNSETKAAKVLKCFYLKMSTSFPAVLLINIISPFKTHKFLWESAKCLSSKKRLSFEIFQLK